MDVDYRKASTHTCTTNTLRVAITDMRTSHTADAGPARQRASGIAGRLLAAGLCALVVLPCAGAQAQLDVPIYTNISRILHILGNTWRGSGYDDNGDAHYLFQPLPPEDMTGQFVQLAVVPAVALPLLPSPKCRSLLASSGRARPPILPSAVCNLNVCHVRQRQIASQGQESRRSAQWKC